MYHRFDLICCPRCGTKLIPCTFDLETGYCPTCVARGPEAQKGTAKSQSMDEFRQAIGIRNEYEWFLEILLDKQWIILTTGNEECTREKFELLKLTKPVQEIRLRNHMLVVEQWDLSELWKAETCECGGEFYQRVSGVVCKKCGKGW